VPLSWEDKRIEPQYLMSKMDSGSNSSMFKCATRGIARTTDTRSAIGTLIPDFPCGDTLGILHSDTELGWLFPVVYNSFVFDWMLRQRMASARVNFFILEELPTIKPAFAQLLRRSGEQLLLSDVRFAGLWNRSDSIPWRALWALSRHERRRVRAISEALIAEHYGLDRADFLRVVEGCDFPIDRLESREVKLRLDPKGFWRYEKAAYPEHRLAMLSLIAFDELLKIGDKHFLALNEGEGWMLPETVRLADYGLGHDDRAKEHQPVATALGPRFYPWQLEQSLEESWEECERHTEVLAKLFPPPDTEKQSDSVNAVAIDLFGNPVETNLFGDPLYARSRKH
jgi:hypothetical protein